MGADTVLGSLGPWRIERALGRGGMASVYLGVHEASGLRAALKVHPRSRSDSSLDQRFKREVDLLRQVAHPHVVRVYEAGQTGDLLWYAMEYLPFPDLAKLLKGTGPVPVDRALGFGLGVAEALACFHPLGVVHRDLKPANLVVAEGDRVVVVDFGLAHADDKTALTATGALIGTPMYMAPEAWRGERATPATDLYQLGVVLFELLTGATPFRGTNVQELARACQVDPVPPLRAIRADVPPALVELVGRCLAKRAEDRPPDAAVVAASLARLRDGAPAEATRPVARPSTDPEPGAAKPPPLPSARSNARPAVAAATVLAVLALALVPRAFEPPGPPASPIQDLTVTPGLAGARVTWRQPSPGPPGRVEVLVGGRTEAAAPGSADGAALVQARVALRPGRPVSLRVVLPDDSASLPVPLTVEPLRLTPVRFALEGGFLRAAWRSSRPVASLLSVALTDGTTVEHDEPGARTEHGAELEVGKALVVRLTVTSAARDGSTQEDDLSRPLREAGRRAAQALAFNPTSFANAVGFDLTSTETSGARLVGATVVEVPEEERRRAAQMAAALDRMLADRGYLAAEAAVRPFLPFLLEQRLLPRAERQELFAGLANLDFLAAFVRCRNLPLRSKVAPALGPFTTRSRPTLLEFRSLSEAIRPPKTIYSFNPLVDEPTTHEWRFTLDGAARTTRAELVVAAVGIQNSLYLRVVLNGGPPFYVHRLAPTGMTYTGFDPELLRDGQNTLAVTAQTLPGVYNTARLTLRSLGLALEP